jgi:hypothetical protein
MVDSSFQYLSQDNQFTSLSVIKDQSRFGWENEAAHIALLYYYWVCDQRMKYRTQKGTPAGKSQREHGTPTKSLASIL